MSRLETGENSSVGPAKERRDLTERAGRLADLRSRLTETERVYEHKGPRAIAKVAKVRDGQYCMIGPSGTVVT